MVLTFLSGVPSAMTSRRSHLFLLPAFLVVLLFGVFWLAAVSDSPRSWFSMTGQKGGTDYYNLLVDGFLDGHTYMKVDPHPDLLSSDPNVRRNAPTLLDANFYQGHFYLYYGVTPAVLMMLPYSLLTGNDLSPNLVTSFFVTLGFLLSLRLLSRVKPVGGPEALSTAFTFIHWTLLAYAPATLFLVRRSSFYEIPLSAGYACVMGLFVFVERALRGTARNELNWACASVCFGLAVGCHPNYLFAGPVLLGWLWFSPRSERPKGARIQLLATILPAAILGAGLAAYNEARFGSALEFGFRYGQNEFFSAQDQFTSWRFLWPNFRWYFLTPPTVSCYFPFVYPLGASFRPIGYHGAEVIHGEFPLTVLFLWTLIGVAFLRLESWPRRIRILTAGMFAIGVIGTAFVCFLGIRANRYLVDGVAPLLLGTVILSASAWTRAVASAWGRVWGVGWIVCAAFAVLFNVGAALQQFDHFANTRPKTFAALSSALNPSWKTLSVVGLAHPAPSRIGFDATFKPQPRGIVEPLFTTGIPYYSDTVYAVQHPGNRIEILIDHYGFGGPRSALLEIEPGRPYRFELDLGSLYPPVNDAYFAGLSDDEKGRVKRRGVVRMDGAVVLNTSMAFYDSPPWRREFGANRTTLTEFSRKFSGTISGKRWLPVEDLARDLRNEDARGVYRLHVDFSSVPVEYGEPLLSAGDAGHGTLLFVTKKGQRYSFHVDEWGVGGSTSEPLQILPGDHLVEIVVGPLAAAFYGGQRDTVVGAAALSGKLLVLIDGRLAAELSIASHSDVFRKIWFGANPQGFSTAESVFRGNLQRANVEPDEAAEILRLLVSARN